MSHFSVLILGDDPEGQLHPFAELDDDGHLAEDPRAEFIIQAPAGAFAEKVREYIAIQEKSNPALADKYCALLDADGPEATLKSWFGGGIGPNGDWGYFTNPDSKWDWFAFGGRFQGMLRLIPGRKGNTGERSWTNDDEPVIPGTCDQAAAGDIDWPTTRQAFTPFAVIKDGEWYEQGDSGWFDSPTASAEADAAWAAEVDALLKDLPPESLVSVYDCHV